MLAHAAGVDDDDVGVDVARRRARSRPGRADRHALGVVEVHLAAEGLDQIFLRHASSTFGLSLSPFAFRLSPLAAVPSSSSRALARDLLRDARRRQSSARSLRRARPSSSRVDASSPSGSPRRDFSIRNCVVPRAAICGRCVMHSTWNRRPAPGASRRRRRRRGRRCRHRPRRRSASCRARLSAASVFSASMTRDSSPPETMRASGRSSSPGFGETKNSAWSMPRSLHAVRRQLAVVEPDLEPRPRHRELREQRLEVARKRDGAPSAALRDRSRATARKRGGRRVERRWPDPRRARLPPRQQLALARQRVALLRSRPRSVGPYFRFSRSSSASRSSTCCSRPGDASMPSA